MSSSGIEVLVLTNGADLSGGALGFTLWFAHHRPSAASRVVF